MIYGMTTKGRFQADFGLGDQIQRASVSAISNIAEGFESKSNAEFHRFLVYARRSVSEVKSQLYVALDEKYISDREFDLTYGQAEKTGKLINGFIRFLSSTTKPKPGNQLTIKQANQS